MDLENLVAALRQDLRLEISVVGAASGLRAPEVHGGLLGNEQLDTDGCMVREGTQPTPAGQP